MEEHEDDGRRVAAQRLEVSPDAAGSRLDTFLARHLDVSRAAVRRLLGRGAVRVGGRVQSATAKGLALRPGEVVEVDATTRPEDERVLPQPELRVSFLAEGDGWVVVDKPAGVPVHPLAPDETGCVTNALIARHPELHGVGEGALRSGVVHRLDVDTSGALLVATRADAWTRLRQAFRDHRVAKRYRAIVRGEVEGDALREHPLVVARHRPARVRVAKAEAAADARPTTTRWRVVERLRGATLLEVETTSGFLHQVRAVLAHEGHPLVGDATYADASSMPDTTGADRHMLHAASLSVDDVAAESPDAPDFAQILEGLRVAGA